jgi:hypothetical protein
MAQLNVGEHAGGENTGGARPPVPQERCRFSLHSIALTPRTAEAEETGGEQRQQPGSGVDGAPAPESGAISSSLLARNFSAEVPLPIKPVLS